MRIGNWPQARFVRPLVGARQVVWIRCHAQSPPLRITDANDQRPLLNDSSMLGTQVGFDGVCIDAARDNVSRRLRLPSARFAPGRRLALTRLYFFAGAVREVHAITGYATPTSSRWPRADSAHAAPRNKEGAR